MLSLESLQGAFKKALVYSNARSAFSPPAKASGDEDEQDFLDGDGNLVDELVALDTIEALPESERAAAIADATARGSFKALQPFITQESPRGTVMEGCIVNASEEDWSLSPVTYVSHLYEQHRSYGLVKIVPPNGGRPLDVLGKGLIGRRISRCNRQTVTELAGGAVISIDNEPLTSPARSLAELAKHWFDPGTDLPQVRDFRTSQQLFDAARKDALWRDSTCWTPDMVEKGEKMVWDALASGHGAEYSSENEFTSYPSGSGASARWNLRDLQDALSVLRGRHQVVMPGINTPFTYFGASGSAFAFHKEDYDLASVNVHCLGAPKIWYSIHEADVPMFEEYAATILPTEAAACPHFLRHKRFLFNPQKLADTGIRVFRTVQMPGDHIVTFPLGYHGGINLGFNVNEAINIAPYCWPEHAVRAVTCDETGHVGNAGAAEAGYAIFAKYLGFVREQWLALDQYLTS